MSTKFALRAINFLLLLMVVLVPLVFARHAMYIFIIPKTAIFQALAEVIIFLYIALALVHKEFRPKFTPLTITLFSFLGILTLTSFLGKDIWISLWSIPDRTIGLVALWHFGLLYLALASLRSEIKWRWIWFASLATSAIVSIIGILGLDIVSFKTFLALSNNPRPGSTFGNPTFLAGYLIFHLFIGAYLFLKEKNWFKWGVALVLLLDLGALVRTQTRGDLLGLLAGVFLLFVLLACDKMRPFDFKRSVLRNPALILVIIILAFGAAFLTTRNDQVWQRVPGLARFSDAELKAGDYQNRLYAWQAAYKSFLEKPVFGWGWENFNLAFQGHYDPRLLSNTFDETYWDKPHNIFIEYAVTGGALTLISFLALLGVFGYEIYHLKDKALKYLFLGALLAYAVRNFFIFDTIGTYLLFYLVAAQTDFLSGGEGKPLKIENRDLGIASYFLIAISLLPVYFLNWQMTNAALLEYGGPNYYLNGMLADSSRSFNQALAVGSPYRDFTRIDFASVVRQSAQAKTIFPNIETLQAKLVKEIKTVIADHPENYQHYTFLAEFEDQFYQLDPGYLKDAAEALEEAKELSPERQQVWYAIGRNYLLSGDLQKGYDAFEKAVALNPNAGDPHFYFGLLAYEMGDAAKGLAEIDKAKSLGRLPNDRDEAVLLATLTGDVGHDYNGAIAYYREALALPGDDQSSNEIELKIAIAYYLNNDFKMAKETFNDLAKKANLRNSPVFADLQPVLDGLGVKY